MKPSRVVVPALLFLLAGCDKLGLDLGSSSGEEADASSVAAQAAPSAPAAARGPSVTIPAGTFKAGSACGATPRITNEELAGESVALGAYAIDAHPYPNDLTKPARTGVTQAEAAALCAADGKRLCSELEWERACKGPAGTTFDYGPTFDPAKCKLQADLMPGKRPGCASGFGVMDMHGLAFEWTSSAWGRGTSGELASVRGGQGASGVVQARCANGQSRPPTASEPDLGFRCCSGPANAAEVRLAPSRLPAMVAEPSVETSLGGAMMRVMPADHRTVSGADVAFDRVWRWHPRDGEELLVARWAGRPKAGGGSFYELAVFKVCGGAPALLARTRGPVESLRDPGAGADPQKASAAVQTGEDKGTLELKYWYGTVKIEQPAWLKEGNSIDTQKKPALVRVPLRPKN